MKNLLSLTLLLMMLFLSTVSVDAAIHYVRAGAAGSNNGTDWTNAFVSLPASLVRGDTYYIADGNYTGYTFKTPASGAMLTTIKKATLDDHGTSTGWDNSFGNGQAIFNGQINFLTSYWVFDGQVGGGPGSWTTGHGFKIVMTSIDAGILIGNTSFSNQSGNITISHFEVQGTLNTSGGGSRAQDGVAIIKGTGLNTVRYFYLHDLGRCPFFLGVQDFTAEYGYTGHYLGTSAQHSEVMSLFDARGLVTFRYNLVAHSDQGSTGGLMLDTQNGGSVAMYGNIFAQPAGDTWGGSNGVVGGWTGGNGEQFNRISFYNNTLVSIGNVTALGTFPKIHNATVAQNNLFYSVSNPGGGSVWETISHNHFISTSAIGTNTSTGSGNPFVNVGALDFRLTAATPAGNTLASPYDRDMYGNVRGADGVWDRGAIEFINSNNSLPNSPTNLRVQ